MPPPPPPPPPLLFPPSVPTAASNVKKSSGEPDRNALLSQIRQGANLKKSTTNDRSAPVTNGKTPGGPSAGNGKMTMSNGPQMGTAPLGLGSLFAQGMPKLKSTNQSFLQGGTYKSQLNPRPRMNNDGPPQVPANSNNLQHQEETLRINNIHDQSSGASMDRDSSNGNGNEKKDEQTSPVNRPQPPSSRKPNLNSAIILKSNAVKNILQKNGECNLGGSEPNLSVESPSKPKSLNKPLPPPRAVQKNATICPVKLNIDLKYRSYEDSDVPSKSETKVFEKGSNFTLRPQMLNNRSEPSNLNKIVQNGSPQLPVAPSRQHNRRDRPVKPTTAPPPLPVRVSSQFNTLPNPVRQGNHMRDLPPPPPQPPPPPPVAANSTNGSLSMPPPPPPRILQQSVSSLNSGRTLPSVPKNVPINALVTGLSAFEARFQFHRVTEFTKPEGFSGKIKSYPSKNAGQGTRRRARHPPPQAPPPPPPVRTG